MWWDNSQKEMEIDLSVKIMEATYAKGTYHKRFARFMLDDGTLIMEMELWRRPINPFKNWSRHVAETRSVQASQI